MAESKKTIKNNISQVCVSSIASSSHWDSDLKQSWGNIIGTQWWPGMERLQGEETCLAQSSYWVFTWPLSGQTQPETWRSAELLDVDHWGLPSPTEQDGEYSKRSNWESSKSIFSNKDLAMKFYYVHQLNKDFRWIGKAEHALDARINFRSVQ